MKWTKELLKEKCDILNAYSIRKYRVCDRNGYTGLDLLAKTGTGITTTIATGTKSQIAQIIDAMIDALMYDAMERVNA